MLDAGKETSARRALDAQPDVILKMPDDSIAPLLLALALTRALRGLLAQSWWLVAAVRRDRRDLDHLVWLWPRRELGQTAEARHD